jgi:hypothetical protein
VGAGLDKAIMHKVADATVRSLLARVVGLLARPQQPPGAVHETDLTQPATSPAAPGEP